MYYDILVKDGRAFARTYRVHSYVSGTEAALEALELAKKEFPEKRDQFRVNSVMPSENQADDKAAALVEADADEGDEEAAPRRGRPRKDA